MQTPEFRKLEFEMTEDGIVTTAFLSEGKEYTLTETATPQGYHGLETAMTISLRL